MRIKIIVASIFLLILIVCYSEALEVPPYPEEPIVEGSIDDNEEISVPIYQLKNALLTAELYGKMREDLITVVDLYNAKEEELQKKEDQFLITTIAGSLVIIGCIAIIIFK